MSASKGSLLYQMTNHPLFLGEFHRDPMLHSRRLRGRFKGFVRLGAHALQYNKNRKIRCIRKKNRKIRCIIRIEG